MIGHLERISIRPGDTHHAEIGCGTVMPDPGVIVLWRDDRGDVWEGDRAERKVPTWLWAVAVRSRGPDDKPRPITAYPAAVVRRTRRQP
jgi:hypothetical protein